MEDAFRWVLLLFRSADALRVENFFLRRQLALYIERGVRPHRVDEATRISLALLARLFDWRSALVVVQPATMIRWHRAGWRLLWRMKSRAGVSVGAFLEWRQAMLFDIDGRFASLARIRRLGLLPSSRTGARKVNSPQHEHDGDEEE